VGGHHGPIAFGFVAIGDAVAGLLMSEAEDPAIAFAPLGVAFAPLVGSASSGFLGESSRHSKASISWMIEDVFLPQLFQDLRGFSSFFRDYGPAKKILALASWCAIKGGIRKIGDVFPG
jgi:hypothetical protein